MLWSFGNGASGISPQRNKRHWRTLVETSNNKGKSDSTKLANVHFIDTAVFLFVEQNPAAYQRSQVIDTTQMQNKLEKDPAVSYDSSERNVTEPQAMSLPQRVCPRNFISFWRVQTLAGKNRKLNHPSLMKATANQNY